MLKGRTFTLYTQWQLVHKDDTRYFALIEIEDAAGRGRWLSEMLVEQGLARIYTIGADMPDGTPKEEQEAELRSLERSAKDGQVGAWRF